MTDHKKDLESSYQLLQEYEPSYIENDRPQDLVTMPNYAPDPPADGGQCPHAQYNPSSPQPGAPSYLPQPFTAQNQSQNVQVVLQQPQPVPFIYQAEEPNVDVTGSIIYAVVVLLCCNFLFGLIAVILSGGFLNASALKFINHIGMFGSEFELSVCMVSSTFYSFSAIASSKSDEGDQKSAATLNRTSIGISPAGIVITFIVVLIVVLA
jgi:hypothetical protein